MLIDKQWSQLFLDRVMHLKLVRWRLSQFAAEFAVIHYCLLSIQLWWGFFYRYYYGHYYPLLFVRRVFIHIVLFGGYDV
jgi:hypothetical protein